MKRYFWRPPGSNKLFPISKETADVLRLGGFEVKEVLSHRPGLFMGVSPALFSTLHLDNRKN